MTTFHYQDFDKKEITFRANNDLALCSPEVNERIKGLVGENVIRALLITDNDNIHVASTQEEFNALREKFPESRRTETRMGTNVDGTARLVKMFNFRNIVIWEIEPDEYVTALGWN